MYSLGSGKPKKLENSTKVSVPDSVLSKALKRLSMLTVSSRDTCEMLARFFISLRSWVGGISRMAASAMSCTSSILLSVFNRLNLRAIRWRTLAAKTRGFSFSILVGWRGGIKRRTTLWLN